jgi:hypothetical protein
MSYGLDLYLEEVQDVSSTAHLRSAQEGTGGLGMDTAKTNKLEERESAIQRILSHRNPDRIQQGIEAYKRDLASWISKHKEFYVIAYDGSDFVAIAPTHRKLEKKLSRIKDLDRDNLFIACISSPEENEDRDMGL